MIAKRGCSGADARRHAWPVLVVAALTLAPLLVAPPPGDAAVVCERVRKKRAKVHLRAERCKAKETVIFDTSDAASNLVSQGQQLAAQAARVGRIEGWLDLVCEGDPQREMLQPPADIGGPLVALGYASIVASACRTLDDDPAACARKFEVRQYGASACAYVRGKCIPCDLVLAAAGICANPCQPPTNCPNDPSRSDAVTHCSDLGTQVECDRSWSSSSDFAVPGDAIRGTSCYWNAGVCETCDAEAVSIGSCTNTCLAAADLPRCRDASRTFGHCAEHDGDQPTCGTRYEAGPYGTTACWYDVAGSKCERCDPDDEAGGKCTNPC
jgi:hypothetical protein